MRTPRVASSATLSEGALTLAPASLGALPLPHAGEGTRGALTLAPASHGALPLPQAGEGSGLLSRLRERRGEGPRFSLSGRENHAEAGA